MNTGILVHGCHLDAYDWRGIAWGYPQMNQLGRIAKAVLVAHQENAALMVFGTGASERVINSKGKKVTKKEGEYTLDYMLKNFNDLDQFKVFQKIDLADLQGRIFSISRFEIQSQNTKEEVENSAELFLKEEVNRLILVSSPTHISRCIRDAYTALEQDKFAVLRHHLYATPSDTGYLGYQAKDVVIFEPPHRADRHSHPTHVNMQRVLRIPAKEIDSFLKRMDRILQEEFEV